MLLFYGFVVPCGGGSDDDDDDDGLARLYKSDTNTFVLGLINDHLVETCISNQSSVTTVTDVFY